MPALATAPRVSPHRGARRPVLGTVYVIRLERPIGDTTNRHGWAQHYVGWCADDPEARLAEHRAGRGSRMLAAAAALGIELTIVFTMPGTRDDERAVKRYKDTARWLARARHQLRLPLC